MTVEFIDLERKFNPIPKLDSDDSDSSDLYTLDTSNGVGWDELLLLSRVVILAEAGAGKTAEIENRSIKLSDNGNYSFFLRLEDLNHNFEIAFKIGDIDLFNEWLSGDQKAYFFLDSVDEARIKNERDFHTAIRLFEKKIHKGRARANIYITSRGSAWRANSDFKLVNELFNPKKNESNIRLVNNDTNKDFVVYSFTELTNDQIKLFSNSSGVTDTDEFVKQLISNEADIFAKRPLDLLDLIDFWKKNKRLGSRQELIESSIDNKLSIVEIGRDPKRVALSKLKYGAKKIAAALTFCKQSRVSIPDSVVVDNSLTIQNILNDWDENEITTLLNRPIFEPSLYGTSRFSHRLIREYLTALWIRDEVESNSISLSDLHSLFYRKIYDVTVPTQVLRPVLSWYVLFDEQFSQQVAEISPEVFIDGGDSSKLPVSQRKELLANFCELYGDKEQCYISFDSAAIKRFSSPEMGELILLLLEKYYSYKDLRQILLQIALSSGMVECLDVALKVSLDNELESLSRTLALRLINKVSDLDFRISHAKSVLNSTSKDNEKILAVIIEELGELIPLSELMYRISELETPSKYEFRDIQYSIERFIGKLSFEQSMDMVNHLYDMIDTKPFVNQFRCDISEKYEWLFNSTQALLINILSTKNEQALIEKIFELITRASSFNSSSYYSDGDNKKRLTAIVTEWRVLNNRLFWHDVIRSRERLIEERGQDKTLNRWFQVGCYNKLWNFSYDHLETAIEWVNSKDLIDDKFVAFSLAWQIVKEAGNKQNDDKKLDRVANELNGAEELLYEFRNPEIPDWQKEDEERKKQYAEEKAQKDEIDKENLATSITFINDNMHLVDELKYAQEGNTTNVQMYLYRKLAQLTEERNEYTIDNTKALVTTFGEDISTKFRDFCIKYWKAYRDNILISEGSERNSTKYSTIIALCGVGMEDKLSPNWVKSISSTNALIATRLSLCELNTIPDWLRKVYEVFPQEVISVLVSSINWCYRDKSDEDNSHFVIGKVLNSCDFIHDEIGQSIIKLLEKIDISNYQMLKQSLWLASQSELVTNEQLALLAQNKLTSNSDNELEYLWWALFIGTDADSSLPMLSKKLNELPSENATELAMSVITSLSDRRGYGAISNRNSYETVPHLVTLYKLMYRYIREEDDIDRTGGGCYSPTRRDDAQDARNGLFSSIKEIPGEESYLALKNIANMWKEQPWRKSWVEHLALERAVLDADLEAMTENEFNQYVKKLSNSKSNGNKNKDEPSLNLIFIKGLDIIKAYLFGSLSRTFLTFGFTLLLTGIPGMWDYIRYMFDTYNELETRNIQPVFEWPQFLGAGLSIVGVTIRTLNYVKENNVALREEKIKFKESYVGMTDVRLQDEFERLYKVKNASVSSIKNLLGYKDNKNAVIELFESAHLHVISDVNWFKAKSKYIKLRFILGSIFWWILPPLAIFTGIMMIAELIEPGATQSGMHALWGYVITLIMIIISSIYIHLDLRSLNNAVKLIDYNIPSK